MKCKEILTESISLPSGIFKVTSGFSLSPGGGWRMSFKEGDILKYSSVNKKLASYDPLHQKWINRAPPIQGRETMDINAYGRIPDREAMKNAFLDGTKKISEKELTKLTAGATKEKVMTVREAKRFLEDLPAKQKVKITVV